jgi:tripartite-type tricarboxylate transporter receptor subunit TctC
MSLSQKAIFSGAFAVVICSSAPSATAQTNSAMFYKGSTIRHIVGYPTGATFDTYSRSLARHMGRHIPGAPNIVIQNMPGAGSLVATNYLANAAPRDGSVIGMLNPVNTVDPLLNPQQSKFDARKFAWIGSMNTEISTCGFWSSKVKTVDDLLSKEVIVGATGPSAGSTLDSRIIASVLGLKFKIVTGYPGLTEARLAAQQGEVDGHCGLVVSSLKADLWDDYKKGSFTVPLQMGLNKHPDLPDVPNAFDLVKTEQDRQVLTLIFGPWAYGRPVLAPEGIPEDRLTVLRSAFVATLKDDAFLAEARKLNLEIQPLPPEVIRDTVARIYQTPDDVIQRTRKILGITQ